MMLAGLTVEELKDLIFKINRQISLLSKEIMINKNTCFECNRPMEHKHHVVPQSLGGTKTIPLCSICHAMIHAISLKDLAKANFKKAQLEGRVGRPKLVDGKEALEMINQGLSYGHTAKLMGVSKSAVHRAVKEARKDPQDE